MQHKTTAVVIGQGGYNDMGLIRSCGEAGMKVVMVAPSNILIPLYKSKYVVKWIRLLVKTEQQLESVINEIISEYQLPIAIYPASDLAACIVDKYSLSASGGQLILPNAGGRLLRLMDKANMGAIASKCGLKVPESVKLDLRDFQSTPPMLPCIIKPLHSIAGDKGDITICRDSVTYQKAVDKYKSKASYNVLIQSLIDEKNQEEIAITGVSCENGEILTNGVIHKKRIRDNGCTVFATYKPEIDVNLKLMIKCFIKAVGFKGIFDMEFLKNNNGYYFIECNFRNGAYGYAVTSAGFNMPEIFAFNIGNKQFGKVDVKQRTFMEERSDILNVLEHNISILHWLNDVIHTDTFLWWNWKDMKPFLAHFGGQIKTMISKLIR